MFCNENSWKTTLACQKIKTVLYSVVGECNGRNDDDITLFFAKDKLPNNITCVLQISKSIYMHCFLR